MNKETIEVLDNLKSELERLKNATDHIDDAKEAATEATEAAKQLHGKIGSLIEKIEQKTNGTIEFLKSNSQKTTKEHHQVIKNHEEAITEIKEFSKKINTIDFPTRLEKLDLNVSNTLSGVQKTPDILEKMVVLLDDKLKEISEKTEKLFDEHQSALNKKIKLSIWFICGIGGATLLLLIATLILQVF